MSNPNPTPDEDEQFRQYQQNQQQQQQNQQHDYNAPAQSFSVPRSPSPGKSTSPRRHHRRTSSGSRGRYAPIDNIELTPIREESHDGASTGLDPATALLHPALRDSATTGGYQHKTSTSTIGSARSSQYQSGGSGVGAPSEPTSTDGLLVHDFDDRSRLRVPGGPHYRPSGSAPLGGGLDSYGGGSGSSGGGATATMSGGSGPGGSGTARSSNTLLLSEQYRQQAAGDRGTSSLWPASLRAALFLLSGLLVVTAAATMWASLARSPTSGGVGTLSKGGCGSIRAKNAGLHVIINAVAALTLAATCLSMQLLTAPTRAEVDRAHLARRWLEIGVMGLRNLHGRGGVDLRRLALWCLLGLSTVPVALLFNGAVWVAEEVPAAYTVAAVAPAFVAGAPFQLLPTSGARPGLLPLLQAMQRNASLSAGGYRRVEPDRCVALFATDPTPGRGHVLVVVDGGGSPAAADNALVATLDVNLGNGVRSRRWVCGADVDAGRQAIVPTDAAIVSCASAQDAVDALPLRLGAFVADHCLVQQLGSDGGGGEAAATGLGEGNCRLQFSLPVMLVVVLCIAVKLICVLLTLMRRLVVLATLGDAIASFLERPDDATRNMSSASKRQIQTGGWRDAEAGVPRPWRYFGFWRWQAVGGSRFLAVVVFLLSTAGLFTYLFILSLNVLLNSLPQLPFASTLFTTQVPLPYPSSTTLYSTGEDSLLSLVVFSNLPQLLVATAYLALNSALTRLSLDAAWADFFHRRRALRVSRAPRGMQVRASRGLSLPWHRSGALVVLAALMGWLLSLGFGVLGVQPIDIQTQREQQQQQRQQQPPPSPPPADDSSFAVPRTTLFLSPRPLLGLLILAFLAALCLLGVGLTRFPRKRMPLAGACSAALAAACHSPDEEHGDEVAEKSVQWGVVHVEQGVGRMAFSSGPVSQPVPGRLYF